MFQGYIGKSGTLATSQKALTKDVVCNAAATDVLEEYDVDNAIKVRDEVDDVTEQSAAQPISIENEDVRFLESDHAYEKRENKGNSATLSPKSGFMLMKREMDKLKYENDQMANKLAAYEANIPQTITTRLVFDQIAENDEVVKLYTGIPSSAIFLWLFKGLKDKICRLHYFKGRSSYEYDNCYQGDRPGPVRSLDGRTELLLTLMKLKLNLLEADLSVRFEVSVQHVSAIISTYIPFLGLELKKFIIWPSVAAIKNYNPLCFRGLGNVISIIDCTEISAQTPSLAKSNSQMFSSYKHRTTVKLLVGCSTSGSVSYLSKVSGGSMSDREIVVRSDFLDYVQKTHLETSENTVILADKGFNIQDILLPYNVKLMIPPFLKGKKQLSEHENQMTKRIASSRIHIERVINRIKNFKILQHTVASEFYDLIDYIVIICGAIVNLNPPIIPMK